MNRRFVLLYPIILIVILSGFSIFQAAGSKEQIISIVYVGEKGDESYLERAFQGLYQAQEDFHITIREIQWNNSEPVDPVTDAKNVKSDAVIIMGDIMNGYEQQMTSQYPNIPVIIIDGSRISGPEIKSISFSMYGASYLSGILAANQTKTGKIGVIAGVDAPVLRGFTDGFVDGANQENPNVQVNISYIADDYSGFSMPERAGKLTSEMYKNGTDIIYQVAGASGTGVIDTANTLPGMFIIGSDSDQSVLAPETVLASAIKNLDSVIYHEVEDVSSGSFVAGSNITGLADEGSTLVLNPGFENLSPLTENRKTEAITKEAEYLASHPFI